MAGPDPVGQDADDVADDEAFVELQRKLFEEIEAFMQAQDVDDGFMVELLVDAAVHLRLTAYGLDVEKPSVAGLKLDLDRLRQEVEQVIRDGKKGAEDFIDRVKEARAQEQEASEPEAG
jgi:hypothetical protein